MVAHNRDPACLSFFLLLTYSTSSSYEMCPKQDQKLPLDNFDPIVNVISRVVDCTNRSKPFLSLCTQTSFFIVCCALCVCYWLLSALVIGYCVHCKSIGYCERYAMHFNDRDIIANKLHWLADALQCIG